MVARFYTRAERDNLIATLRRAAKHPAAAASILSRSAAADELAAVASRRDVFNGLWRKRCPELADVLVKIMHESTEKP